MGTQLLLDGGSMSSESDFHDAIDEAARAVGLIGYGRNLDALWDVLTGFLERPVEVRWINAAAAQRAFGPRFNRVIKILEDADQELGDDFTFELQE